jgi:TfoX/Sxy family transcriptional regulator of competence genes
MAYDELLAERIRRTVGQRSRVSEKKMFGGLAFLLGGKMFCGIVKDDLVVRVGPERYEEALGRPHVRPMDFTGRPMNGYVFVAPAGCSTEKAVSAWVATAATFVSSLEVGPAEGRTKPRRSSSRRRPQAK